MSQIVVAGSAEFHTNILRSLVEVQFWRGEKLLCNRVGIVVVSENGYYYIIADSARFINSIRDTRHSVEFPNGDAVDFALSSVVIQDGMAAFCIRHTAMEVNAVVISGQKALKNETIYMFSFTHGFFDEGSFVLAPGSSKGRLTPGNVTSVGVDMFMHDCASFETCDSGSPLFNASGQLVGIRYADADKSLLATDVERIRKQINSIRGMGDQDLHLMLQHAII